MMPGSAIFKLVAREFGAWFSLYSFIGVPPCQILNLESAKIEISLLGLLKFC